MIPDFCPAGSRGLLGNFWELFKINKIIFRLKTEIFTNSTEIMDQRNPKRVLLLSPDVYRSCLSLRGNDLLSRLTDIRMWRRGNSRVEGSIPSTTVAVMCSIWTLQKRIKQKKTQRMKWVCETDESDGDDRQSQSQFRERFPELKKLPDTKQLEHKRQ